MFDVISEIVANPVITSGFIAVGRNVFGWVKNSLEDGKIDQYEWQRLGKTFVTLGGLALFTYLGINATFAEIGPAEATGIAALIDVLRSHFKK